MNEKACPVIIRTKNGVHQILSFTHPTAGNQLVKGGVEEGETYEQAARRELAEESGIAEVTSGELIGDWNTGQQHWYFVQFEVNGKLPDKWEFFTEDGGGMLFNFFWFDLDDVPDETWHPVFVEALSEIRDFLK